MKKNVKVLTVPLSSVVSSWKDGSAQQDSPGHSPGSLKGLLTNFICRTIAENFYLEIEEI